MKTCAVVLAVFLSCGPDDTDSIRRPLDVGACRDMGLVLPPRGTPLKCPRSDHKPSRFGDRNMSALFCACKKGE